jgi:septal ring factor EnvC (AmiA/AmiB activator)
MINSLTNFTCVEDQEAYDAYCLCLMGVLEELIREVDVQHSDIRQQHSDIRQQHSDMDSLINVLKDQQTEIVKMAEELKGLFSP